MNKLLCRLTGGHKYRDENLRTVYIQRKDKYVFTNYCVKCNEIHSWSVPAKNILGGLDTDAGDEKPD